MELNDLLKMMGAEPSRRNASAGVSMPSTSSLPPSGNAPAEVDSMFGSKTMFMYIAAALVVLAVVGVAYYYWTKKKTETEELPQVQNKDHTGRMWEPASVPAYRNPQMMQQGFNYNPQGYGQGQFQQGFPQGPPVQPQQPAQPPQTQSQYYQQPVQQQPWTGGGEPYGPATQQSTAAAGQDDFFVRE